MTLKEYWDYTINWGGGVVNKTEGQGYDFYKFLRLLEMVNTLI